MLLHVIVRRNRKHFEIVYSQGFGVVYISYNPDQAVMEQSRRIFW